MIIKVPAPAKPPVDSLTPAANQVSNTQTATVRTPDLFWFRLTFDSVPIGLEILNISESMVHEMVVYPE